MNSNLLFIGDVGWDYYPSDAQYRPGGCSLNAFIAACGGIKVDDIQLALPNLSHSKSHGDLLGGLRAKINSLSFDACGELPVQEITVNGEGERFFGPYSPGYIDNPLTVAAAKIILAARPIIAIPLYRETYQFFKNFLPLLKEFHTSVSVDLGTLADFDFDLLVVESIAENLLVVQVSISGDQGEAIKKDAMKFSKLFKNIHFVLTRGEKAGYLIKAGEVISFDTVEGVRVVDSTGAGDAFFGAYVYQITSGSNIEDALGIASKVAARVVQHLGGCALKY